ncbi:MAG: hypothetical protein QM713_15450 [Arachnia sp.]
MKLSAVLARGAVGIAILGLGVGIGAGTVLLREPDALAVAAAPAAVPVVSRVFDDPKGTDVEVRLPELVALSSPLRGRVTDMQLKVGTQLESGDLAFRVDDQPVWALATDVPLWRDLKLGDTGSDVASLQRELARIGLRVKVTEDLDDATLRAVAELQGEAEPVAVVHESSLLWIPARSLEIRTLRAKLGDSVEQNSPIAEADSGAAAVRVVLPASAVVGKRVLVVDSERLDVEGDGTITGEGVDTVLASSVFRLAKDQNDPASEVVRIRATSRLAVPVTAYGVPPASIVEAPGKVCVFEEGQPVIVEVLGSQLGLSLVSSSRSLTEVSTRPAADASCG